MQVVCKKLVKKYGTTTAVHDLDLEIAPGSMHFLLGPSGCGKTTFLRLLAGLEKPSYGNIFFDGLDVTHKSSAERNIGMVFQNYALWPHMSVWENIAYGLKLRKTRKGEINSRIEEMLEITQLERFSKRLPGQLSGGQQQRVALARALAIKPHILLLDEPLSNLDAKLRHEMRDNISRIFRNSGITMVYVTHDQKEALSMASTISVMHGGYLIQTGSPRELYNHPQTPFIAGFIGDTNLFPSKLLSEDAQGFQLDSPFGSLQARRPRTSLKFAPGNSVVLSVRPEAFKIAFNNIDYPGQNSFSAAVAGTTYLGDSEQIECTYGDGKHFRISLFHNLHHTLNPGDVLRLSIDPEDIVVLPPQKTLGRDT